MIVLEYLRSFRVGPYALFDLGVSFLGIYLLAPLLTRLFLLFKIKVSRKGWLLLTLPISIIAHLLVGTHTQMTKDFFDINGHYGIKTILLALLIIGSKEVKIIKKK